MKQKYKVYLLKPFEEYFDKSRAIVADNLELLFQELKSKLPIDVELDYIEGSKEGSLVSVSLEDDTIYGMLEVDSKYLNNYIGTTCMGILHNEGKFEVTSISSVSIITGDVCMPCDKLTEENKL